MFSWKDKKLFCLVKEKSKGIKKANYINWLIFPYKKLCQLKQEKKGQILINKKPITPRLLKEKSYPIKKKKKRSNQSKKKKKKNAAHNETNEGTEES